MAAAGSSGVEEVLQNSARRERKRRSGRRSRDQDPDVRLSKALSYALRHGAEILSLHMSSDGFVDLGEILRLPQFKAWSEEDVKRVVETNEKQRFALCRHPSSGHLQIRANQGHSLQVPELELTPLQELQDFPETVAHGTLLRHWPAIRQHGLSRMGRTHIHLAPGLPAEGAILSGMRNSSEVAIILDIPKALADGISFFRSANRVILSPGNAEGLLLPATSAEHCSFDLGVSSCLLSDRSRHGSLPFLHVHPRDTRGSHTCVSLNTSLNQEPHYLN